MDVSIIVPTYEEAENVRPLIKQLGSVMGDSGHEYEILIVDDNSPDGTAAVARRVGEETGYEVRVFIRTREPDLSRSVVCGMREANGAVLVVMDADLQHPPDVVPTLVDQVRGSTPVAVGTRYGSGGDIENWTVYRRIVSHGARLLSWLLVPPTRTNSDPISGFFAVKADAVDYDRLQPNGYKILIELLTVIRPDDVAEVGFRFRDRREGTTDLDFEQYVRFLVHILNCAVRSRA